MRKLILHTYFFLFLFVLISCSNSEVENNSDSSVSTFEKINSKSGFNFSNNLDEDKLTSPFNYINLYSGAGVAVGDINNDGLQDLFFASNMSSSKLFLNKGNMEFEDITDQAGCKTEGWCTGVTMADINNDGYQDIYVCRAYDDNPNGRKNLLFLNNKDGSFTESAMALGIADENFSIGASFFDYDKDGDLDLIVANHPRYRLISLAQHVNYWRNPVKKFSSRLFRNDTGKFTEVTEESGILSYGFCLSLITSDINNDSWPDLFITVDHDEPDLIFVNNQDGTFTNITDSALTTSSLSSMGIDAADLTGDDYPEIVVAEMLSEDHYREKVIMGMQTVDRFNYLVDSIGYKYYQMHNYLYQNNSNNTLSDISQLAGVSKSDWSWSSLFWDFDNDGLLDLSFTNGYYKDVYHKDRKNKLDSLMHTFNGDMDKMNREAKNYALNATQSKVQNYLYKNLGNLEFENVASDVGLSDKTISSGAAYADLDNDGDLDFIVSNIGEPSAIYENKTAVNNYLRVVLKSSDNSVLNSKLKITANGKSQFRELLSTRGFLSSCEQVIHFGLGKASIIDELSITWPDGKVTTKTNLQPNQLLQISYDREAIVKNTTSTKEIASVDSGKKLGIEYSHKENIYNDYNDQVLLPHKLSEYGPHLSKGDVNGDNIEDVYVSSPTGQPARLFLGTSSGKFKASNQPSFIKDRAFEDGQAEFADVDGDNDLDLLVPSTGYEFPVNDERYSPRLYLNNGKGIFNRSADAIPTFTNSASCIRAADFDSDGDIDFFIGGRLAPKNYPFPGTSAIFINNGKGSFSNNTAEINSDLSKCGMVKDAVWSDLNNDDKVDLIVTGEWMGILIYIQEDGKLIEQTSKYISKPLKGWWNSITVADLDSDGYKDFVLGNLGYNYKYQATEDKPFAVYSKDFDSNGSCDIVLATYYGDEIYPVRGKTCSSEQLPGLSSKIKSFEQFAYANLDEVYGEDLNNSLKCEVTTFASTILYGTANGPFEIKEIPREAQIAPINEAIAKDINKDGKLDLIVAGNLYQSEIETGRASAGTGHILINQGNRKFKVLSVLESGLYLPGDVKSLLDVSENIILAGINKEEIKYINLN